MRTRVLLPALAAVLAVLLAGCRGDVEVGAEVAADGSGSVAVTIGVDEELLAELDGLGIDLTGSFEAAIATDDRWTVERRTDDGGLTVTGQRAVTDAAEIGPVLAALSAGLTADDPAIRLDLDVAQEPDGAVTVTGSARFDPPGRPAATLDGTAIGPDADALAALTEETVDATFALTLPGEVTRSDADEVDGRTLRWSLPVGAEIAIDARSEPPPWWAAIDPLIGAAAVAGVFVLLGLGAWWWRRRGRRDRSQPAGTSSD